MFFKQVTYEENWKAGCMGGAVVVVVGALLLPGKGSFILNRKNEGSI